MADEASHVRPDVSVVICVIDPHPVYFPLAVRSILDQTLANLELIIVEEPSSSDGRELLQGVADARVRHLMHPQRTHLIHQRNRGIEHARAELVAVLDADDVAEPERLEKQLAYMNAHPEVGALGTQLRLIDLEGRPIGYRRYPTDPARVSAALRRFNPIGQPSVMYRRTPVLELGGYAYAEYPATEDYDLWCKLDRHGVKLANLPEPLVRYRIHPGGMKTTKLKEIIRGTIELKQLYFHDQLDAGDRLRLLGERALLHMPPALVMRLFLALSIRSSLGGAPRGAP